MKKSQKKKLSKQQKIALLTLLNLILFSWFFVAVISPLIHEFSELNKFESKYDRLDIPTYQDKKESQS